MGARKANRVPFTSPTFLLVFLPVFLAAYWAARSRALRNALLLIASLLTYAWGEGLAVCLMLISIAANYAIALWIERARGTGRERRPFWFGVVLNLAPLLVLKYGTFLLNDLNALVRPANLRPLPLPQLPLPAGISFFTFMAISYLIAVHRGEVAAERDPVSVGLYISLFPLTLAGPICRWVDIAPQLRDRREGLSSFADGARRFVTGFAKKVLIANTLAVPANAIFGFSPNRLAPGIAWFGLLCYSLQIFFDFAGYSDMAIGIGRMLGLRFMENFDAPYAATSVRAFWTRWHISLSTWFRDYLFLPIAYPVGRAVERIRFTRLRDDFWAYAGGSLATMLLIGLWHGASWGFLLWGVYHGAFLVLERTRFGKRLSRSPRPVQHLYLVAVVAVGWVFFRTPTLARAWEFFAAMAGRSAADPAPIARYALPDVLLATAAGILLSTRLGPALRAWTGRWIDAHSPHGAGVLEIAAGAGEAALFAALFVFSLAWWSARTYVPFIYFGF
jgi:alginate O-acetyltransferase complex protein AlgI